MNQLLLGALVPFLMGVVVYGIRGMRATTRMLVVVPIGMMVGMVWAVLPDFPRLFGYTEFYHRLHKNPRINLFFWHYNIDKIEIESPWYIVAFIVMLILLLFAAWRELHIAEKRE